MANKMPKKMAEASTLVHVSIGGFKRTTNGPVVMEEAGEGIKTAWSENRDELINGFKGERWARWHRINSPIVTMSTPYL